MTSTDKQIEEAASTLFYDLTLEDCDELKDAGEYGTMREIVWALLILDKTHPINTSMTDWIELAEHYLKEQEHERQNNRRSA